MDKEINASFLKPAIMAWWAHVTEAPELSKITVFKKGTSHAESVSIPFGGHTEPISGTGARLAQKKAQKKAKKSIASETMKRIIPKRKPSCTIEVC